MKNALPIVGGIIGALLGFVGGLWLHELLGLANKADPIMSGLIALVVFGPAGAIAGLLLGTKIGRSLRGEEGTGSFAGSSLKALGIVVAAIAIVGGAYYIYALTTATPWLNPNAANPVLQFEVRLPAGAASPASARDVKIELQTDLNRMPGEPPQLRRDSERSVIAGEVELAYRTAKRQLEIKIAGQPDRLYRIGLDANAPHTSALGAWQPNADGSEIRYRAKWPGQS